MRYSIFTLARNALNFHQAWPRAWRSPPPRPEYDYVIVGGGGHGLATAYYLARNHGGARVAVVEKGWLGGGNTARNTTIIRSNYLLPPSAALYDRAVQLWETLSTELNFNVMYSPRGLMHLAHTVPRPAGNRPPGERQPRGGDRRGGFVAGGGSPAGSVH